MSPPKSISEMDDPAALALKRVGNSPESRVRWLLRVASLPPFDDLSDADQDVLSAEMEAFLDPTGDSDGSIWDGFVAHWQGRIQAGVHKLERGKAWGHLLVTHVGLWVPRKDQ